MTHKLLLPAIAGALTFGTVSANADLEAQKAAGQAQYALCLGCHGPDATGLKVGEQLMAPSMHGSKIINGDAANLAKVIMKGIQKEDAKYLGIMAPLEAVLDDQKLADVMTYVRNSYGNKASAVTKEEAASYRAKWKDVKGPVKRADIEAAAGGAK